MSKQLSIHDLLLIENDLAILEFRCPQTGMLLWPHIRIPVYRMIIMDYLFGGLTSGGNTSVSLNRKMETLIRSAVHNARFKLTGQDRCDVCIISDGIANQLMDGKWFNRLSDHFAKTPLTTTLSLEDQFEWRWPQPRHNERVMYLSPQRTYDAVAGRLWVRERHRALARDFVHFVEVRALKCLGWSMDSRRFNQLSDNLAIRIASLQQQYDAFRKTLVRIGPRLLLIGSASFGGLYATFIAAARSLGIATAEYQHGAVSLGHDGYNFSAALRESTEFRQILPDYFLSYGKWWNGQINMPVRKLVIGNPHREARLSQVDLKSGKDFVLILSDGIEFDSYIELARAIEPVSRKQGLRVVIRPHPLERSVVGARHDWMGPISIDDNPDIFSSLARANIVVSELSTVLFDAIGLVDHIYMWDTPKARFAFPNPPFRCFSDPGELAELVGTPRADDTINSEEFWAPAWQSNYEAFLGTLGIGKTAQ